MMSNFNEFRPTQMAAETLIDANCVGPAQARRKALRLKALFAKATDTSTQPTQKSLLFLAAAALNARL